MFSSIIRPSSLYRPTFSGGVNPVIFFKRKRPTNSHTSAPSKEPIVTSKVPFFLDQLDPEGPKINEFLECSTIFNSSSVICVIVLA